MPRKGSNKEESVPETEKTEENIEHIRGNSRSSREDQRGYR